MVNAIRSPTNSTRTSRYYSIFVLNLFFGNFRNYLERCEIICKDIREIYSLLRFLHNSIPSTSRSSANFDPSLLFFQEIFLKLKIFIFIFIFTLKHFSDFLIFISLFGVSEFTIYIFTCISSHHFRTQRSLKCSVVKFSILIQAWREMTYDSATKALIIRYKHCYYPDISAPTWSLNNVTGHGDLCGICLAQLARAAGLSEMS